MATVPGPRTSPTVKPLSNMNKNTLGGWEVRLGMIQMVILLGLITGSVACAFYLGFFSGQRSGFDDALAKSLANMPKIPVVPADKVDEEARQRLSSQLYASLQEAPIDRSPREQVQVPALGVIPSISEKPLNDLVNEIAPPSPMAKEDEGGPVLARSAATRSGSTANEAIGDGTIRSLLPKDESASVTEAESNQVSGQAASRSLGAASVVVKQEGTTDRKQESQIKSQGAPPSVAKAPPSKVLASWSEGGAKRTSQSQAPAEEKKQAPALMKQVIPSGWFAQVAAPKKMEDARLLATKLKNSGFKVVVETADVRGEEYYRVLVGPEDGRKEAQRMVDQLKRESYVRGEPFLKLVK